MLDRLLSTIAPHSCCGCGLLGDILCETCKNNIVSDPFERCLVCLKPTVDDNLCSACRTRSLFDAAWCVGTRQSELKALIDGYKFASARRAGVVCAELLLEQLPLITDETVVVAVPTSPAHVRARGFDHTARIARNVAKARQMRYASPLERVDNETQHFKTRAERLKLTIDSLRVRAEVPPSILLIDDIYTTGATLTACARLLRENGAKQLFVGVVARQVLDEGNDL